MERKTFFLMAIVLLLGLSSLADGFTLQRSTPKQCAVEPKARVNCGYPYISAQECANRGCCFNSSIAGVIWCFFPENTKGLVKKEGV